MEDPFDNTDAVLMTAVLKDHANVAFFRRWRRQDVGDETAC